MPYRFFSIPAMASEAAEKEFNLFIQTHAAVMVEKNFVSDGLNSYWAICVTYKNKEPKGGSEPTKARVDYKEVLAEEDFTIYSQLRELRKKLAEQENVPPYAIFTNYFAVLKSIRAPSV